MMRKRWMLALVTVCMAWACGPSGGEEKVEDVVDLVEEDVCYPKCLGKECGPDGCGGYCGACESGFSCNAQGSCQELPKCELVAEVTCDEVVTGDTTGRANELDSYSCKGYEGLGSDIVYVFQPQQDDILWVTLDAGTNLDVMVTQAPCNPDSCLAWDSEEVQLEVAGGKKYYIVVDGQEGQAGPFSFTVGCNSTCPPQCFGKECGDDGCGGSCGDCPDAAPFCFQGKCQVDCVPDCEGKYCGDDGCGGKCGSCPPGDTCTDGVCSSQLGCVPSSAPGCDGCACEDCVCQFFPDCCQVAWSEICVQLCQDNCGMACTAANCGDGQCAAPSENCGNCPDDCGCSGSQVCHQNTCCTPSCTGKECGDDGCGGSCGDCPEGEFCNQGTCGPAGNGCVSSNEPGCGGCPCEACVCEMDPFCCDNSWDNICVNECIEQCGGCEPVVGCGDGVCAAEEDEDCSTCPKDCACTGGEVCFEGSCCTPECEGLECGDDGCGGVCGNCPGGFCEDGKCYLDGAHCLEAVPSMVDFGSTKVGVLKTTEVLLTNCGSEPVKITAIDMAAGSNEAIGFDPSSLPHVPSPGNPLVLATEDSYTLNVLYLPSKPSDVVNGQHVPQKADIVLTSVEPAQETLISVSGVALDATCPVAAIAVQEGTSVVPLTTLHLDGQGSNSPNGDIVEYLWSVEAPDGVVSKLTPAPEAPAPTFVASLAGTYIVTLEVKDQAGKGSCVPAQVEVTATPAEKVYVEFFWLTPADPDESDEGAEAGSDLDLHLTHPWATGPDIDGDGEPDGWFDSPYDCFWFNPAPNWGSLGSSDDDPSMLRDDTDGAGPEVAVLDAPEAKTYTVGVHYWDDHDFGEALATLRIYVDGVLAAEYADVLLVDLDLWEVAKIAGGTGAVTPVTVEGDYKITPQYVNPFFGQ